VRVTGRRQPGLTLKLLSMLSFPLMAGLDINGACRDACLTERSVGPPLSRILSLNQGRSDLIGGHQLLDVPPPVSDEPDFDTPNAPSEEPWRIASGAITP
jgi:hypothetical protein